MLSLFTHYKCNINNVVFLGNKQQLPSLHCVVLCCFKCVKAFNALLEELLIATSAMRLNSQHDLS